MRLAELLDIRESALLAPEASDLAALDGTTDLVPLLRASSVELLDAMFALQHQAEGFFRASDTVERHAWSTAQCICAALAHPDGVQRHGKKITMAFQYLDRSRHSDGYFKYDVDDGATITDISCWTFLADAWAVARKVPGWAPLRAVRSAAEADERLILQRQHAASGGWLPTAHNHPNNVRTYSTLMAVWALASATPCGSAARERDRRSAVERGIAWLCDQRIRIGRWVPNANRVIAPREIYPGLDAQATYVLLDAKRRGYLVSHDVLQESVVKLVSFGADRSADLTSMAAINPSDTILIGTRFLIEGSAFVWPPWSLAALALASADPSFPTKLRASAVESRAFLLKRIRDHLGQLRLRSTFAETFEYAETLLGLSLSLFSIWK